MLRSRATTIASRGLLVSALLASLASGAHANPASVLPSGAGSDDPTLFHVTLDYVYSIDSATLVREDAGAAVDPLDPIATSTDLAFKQHQHELIPRVELGVFRDVWVSAAMPIILGQARELSLAEGVTRGTSSTIRDGLLTADGFDARDPGTPLPTDGDLLFRGVNRSGIEQLHLGLNVALMNQRTDDTKPTWKLGGELRLAIGNVMRFDRMRAGDETGVSTGVHEVRVWTSIAKRYARTEGWFELFWQVPLTATEDSLFDDIEDAPFGATNTLPGQQAGVAFGLEAYALDDAINNNRVSLDLGGRVVGHFEGRGYSEMWEVFAFAGDARSGGPLVLDRDPTAADVQAASHPGISNIENYLETAARIALRGQLGRRVRFAALVDLIWKTDHAITFADAGVDLPTCGSGASPCEDEANDLVNPGTEEVNPLHVPRIDLVGHRYLSENNFGFAVGVQAQLLF